MSMVKDRVPNGFSELDGQFLQRIDDIRDAVAILLADALHGCADDQRVRNVERAAMINEDLARLHAILWKTLDLLRDGRDEEAGG